MLRFVSTAIWCNLQGGSKKLHSVLITIFKSPYQLQPFKMQCNGFHQNVSREKRLRCSFYVAVKYFFCKLAQSYCNPKTLFPNCSADDIFAIAVLNIMKS